VQEAITVANDVDCEPSFTAMQDFVIGDETFSAESMVITVPDELTTFTVTWQYPTVTLTDLFTLGSLVEVVVPYL
jgi:hypothetical protein